MRPIPAAATLIVAAAVAAMIALGVWQLQRAGWKERLLADYRGAATLPPVDLDPLLKSGRPLPRLAFRRALATCSAIDAAPEVRAGRNAANAPGQIYLVACRPGAVGPAGRLRINTGWANRPDAARRLSVTGRIAGRLGAMEGNGPILLTAAAAAAPLAPSAPPGIENIPNNHLFYAFQWFFFAASAAVIYWLALRRRGAAKLPPGR